MTHDGFLEFFGVLGEVLVDGDADDHDGEPEVKEVQNGVRSVKVLDDRSWRRSCVEFRIHFLLQSFDGVQSHFTMEGLESVVEIHKSGQVNRPRLSRDWSRLGDFDRGFTFVSEGLLGAV